VGGGEDELPPPPQPATMAHSRKIPRVTNPAAVVLDAFILDISLAGTSSKVPLSASSKPHCDAHDLRYQP
jgi:hypothetical protein